MMLIEVLSLLLVAAAGTAVVLTRDPLPQALVNGIYGLALALLFFVLGAPGVAMSELAVGSVAVPLMVLLTLTRVRERKR